MSNYNIVTFSSLEFIFRFLPFFLTAFYLAPSRYKKIVLFLASLVFYAFGAPVFLPLLMVLTAFNCVLGQKLCSHKGEQKERRRWLIAAVLLDVIVLAGFKLLSASRAVLPDGGFQEAAELGLPLGISFYLFKMLSYQIDCYHGKAGQHGWLDAALYFCLFPQLVSGPVMRFEGMERIRWQIKGMQTIGRRLENGLYYFTIGLGAKVLLADRLGILWHDLETIGFESISTPLAWLGAFAFSLELYFDFAGYSLMAAGIGVMLGIPFVQNFAHPYAAGSVREFFRRWHMTLGSWFRDYVYIPLGGNRRGMARCIVNLAAVWILTGLWHGGTLNFLIWGIVLFGFVVAEKLFLGKHLEKHRVFSVCYILAVMPVTWMIFAITDLGQLGIYMKKLFPFLEQFAGRTVGVVNTGDFLKYIKLYGSVLCVSALFCIPQISVWLEKHRRKPVVVVVIALIFWGSIYMIANAALNPFLYFSF
ncbi:MAG: MBOAT family protein [Lachnospiraceae bacterium]|nr:MBOAT family protein [Lachnospiraceae bacterium]